MLDWLFGNGSDNGGDDENIHSATSEKECQKMAKRNNWELKRVDRTNNSILEVDCVFKGKQTSFQDDRNDD